MKRTGRRSDNVEIVTPKWSKGMIRRGRQGAIDQLEYEVNTRTKMQEHHKFGPGPKQQDMKIDTRYDDFIKGFD
jgi:hypothetical protein